MNHTPVKLSVLLHHHYQCDPHPDSGTPSYNKALSDLIDEGLLEYRNGDFNAPVFGEPTRLTTSERGRHQHKI